MAADWHAATLAGDHVIMLAERHYDVDDLNQRARNHLTRNGTISGPALLVDDLTFQAGDRVLCDGTTAASGSATGPSAPSPTSTRTNAR